MADYRHHYTKEVRDLTASSDEVKTGEWEKCPPSETVPDPEPVAGNAAPVPEGATPIPAGMVQNAPTPEPTPAPAPSEPARKTTSTKS